MIAGAVVVLCAIGLYVSLFMLRKTRRAERGDVEGPSVVKEPHARLFFGQPNALFGTFFFPLIAITILAYPALIAAGARGPALALRWIAIFAVIAAVATSCFLAYSLLCVTKRACPYCWIGHAINVALLILVPFALL